MPLRPTDPNTVLVTPRDLHLNRPQLIASGQAQAPKVLAEYQTGQVSGPMPRSRLSVTPTSYGDLKGPPLGKG